MYYSACGFMSSCYLVKELNIPTFPSIPAINIPTLNNGAIGTGITVSLFVIDSLKNVIILGHP